MMGEVNVMASNNCVIDDDYCVKMGEYYKKQGGGLDKMISDYLCLLRTVQSEAIIKGDVAKALDCFIKYAEKMQEQIGIISDAAQTQVTRFLDRVDETDKYLF